MRDQVLGQDSFWCWLASTGSARVPHPSPKHYLCQAFALGLAIARLGELSLLGAFDCLSATCGLTDTHTGAGDGRHLLSMWFIPQYFRGFHIFDIWLPGLQLPLLKHVRAGTLLDFDLLQIFSPLRIQQSWFILLARITTLYMLPLLLLIIISSCQFILICFKISTIFERGAHLAWRAWVWRFQILIQMELHGLRIFVNEARWSVLEVIGHGVLAGSSGLVVWCIEWGIVGIKRLPKVSKRLIDVMTAFWILTEIVGPGSALWHLWYRGLLRLFVGRPPLVPWISVMNLIVARIILLCNQFFYQLQILLAQVAKLQVQILEVDSLLSFLCSLDCILTHFDHAALKFESKLRVHRHAQILDLSSRSISCS